MIYSKSDLSINDFLKTPAKKSAFTKKKNKILKLVEKKIPNHKSEDIKNYWSAFKFGIWKEQGCKCCFCDKHINEQESHLEHYRPKTEVRDLDGALITRASYYWLAYSLENFLVSCPTCNIKKGNKFPLVGPQTLVSDASILLDENGSLGDEDPLLLNPRFITDIENYFSYAFTNDGNRIAAFIQSSNKNRVKAAATIEILDLNRTQTNEERYRDNLPLKRGEHYLKCKTALEKYFRYFDSCLGVIANLDNSDPEDREFVREIRNTLSRKKKNIISEYFGKEAEFIGLSAWCKNYDFPDYELGRH